MMDGGDNTWESEVRKRAVRGEEERKEGERR